MIEREYPFSNKSRESLAGAELEFESGWYNNCANRAYYACFQGAIIALQRAGVRARGEQWGHEFVPAQFDGMLIHRRYLYSPDLRGVLGRLFMLRQTGDYDENPVSRTEAERALRRARTFLAAIEGGES